MKFVLASQNPHKLVEMQAILSGYGIEVVLDRDGRHEVRLLLSAEVSPRELAEGPAPEALHDGDHHIRHQSPALEELRDRLAVPSGPLRRVLDGLRERLVRRA